MSILPVFNTTILNTKINTNSSDTTTSNDVNTDNETAGFVDCQSTSRG